MIPDVVSTPRLRLRALTRRDLVVFRKLYCDAGTMRHIGRPLRPAEAAPSLRATVEAACQPDGPKFFVIVQGGNRRSIGLCSIRGFSEPMRRVELGIMLVRAARGHGYAREAFVALIEATFRALPIDMVWVQHSRANAGAARLNEALGFRLLQVPCPGVTKVRQRVWTMRRSEARFSSDQPTKGNTMSSIIGFLENAGRDAALRHASREQLLRRMREEKIESTLGSALLQPRLSTLNGLLGVRDTMFCLNQAKPPPKKKAPARKKPAKAPPKKAPAKKAPAKKPAKKAPAKRKR